MFRRVSIRLPLSMGNIILVAVALYIATRQRPQLSFGKPLDPEQVGLTWPVYTIVLGLWLIGFFSFDAVIHWQGSF